MTQISLDEVRRIAALARLTLSEEEIPALAGDLGSILKYIKSLESLDTSNISPTTHAVLLETLYREDAVTASLPVEAALQNAPERLGDGFGVPKIIE